MAGRRGRSGGGDYEPPEIRGEARKNLAQRMTDALRGNRAGGGVQYLVNLLGGRGRGGGTGKLADAIAAETGENRRTVLRRIQRSLRGEAKTPVDKGTGVVEQKLRSNAADVMRASSSINASVQAWVTVSSETYPTQRTARAHLTGARAEEFAAAIETGDYESAVHILFAAYWGEQAGGIEIHDFGEIQF